MTKLHTIEPSVPQHAGDALCSNLLEGLHAASQPLTILRASLGSPDVTRHSVEDLRKLIRRSSKEVERLCVFFDYLQQFVVLEDVPAEPEIEDLTRMMEHALEGVDLLFAEAGVRLTFERGMKAEPRILVDSSRLEQALSNILLAILERAQRDDEVILTTHGPGACIDMAILAAPAPSAVMRAETRLSMALAAANLRSQGAEIAWEQAPFSVQIALPVVNTVAPS